MTCPNCSKEVEGRNKFCDLQCFNEQKIKDNISDWLSGYDPGWTGQARQLKTYVRTYLLEKANFACSQCGWDKRHPDDDRPLVEIDHIDGDAENCRPNNLRVLCPNCHAMTANHRARNYGYSTRLRSI